MACLGGMHLKWQISLWCLTEAEFERWDGLVLTLKVAMHMCLFAYNCDLDRESITGLISGLFVYICGLYKPHRKKSNLLQPHDFGDHFM